MRPNFQSRGLTIGLVIWLAMQGNISSAQQRIESHLSDEKLKNIDKVFTDHIQQKDFGGMITLIARNGLIAQKKAYGFSNVEKKIPMETSAILPIASMTKIATTVAVLILYEEGRFRLNDPIEKYIPEFKGIQVLEIDEKTSSAKGVPTVRKLTIRHLLSHTSGIGYGTGQNKIDSLYRTFNFQNWQGSLKLFVEKMASVPLKFQPGQRWEYGYSHDVLGYLVEVISGRPLNVFLKERVFDPLGMSDTDFMVPSTKFNRLPQLYQFENHLKPEPDSIRAAYCSLPFGISGGGGWYTSYGGICTSIDDFLKLARLILDFGIVDGNRLLSRKSIELMISNQTGQTENMNGSDGYGLGIGVRVDANKYGEISSDGEVYWAGGPYNSFFWVDFRERMIGIMFTNTGPFGHAGLMNRFKILAVQAIDD